MILLDFTATQTSRAIGYQNLSVGMNGDITLHGSPSLRTPTPRQWSFVDVSSVVRTTWRLGLIVVSMLIGLAALCPSVSSAAVKVSKAGAGNGAHQARAHKKRSTASHSLTAPKYDGYSICTDATGLKIAQGRTQIVSGSAYVTIIFVNAGTSNCYLNGTPFTQPVGVSYTPVGPPAAAYFDPSRGGYVVLDAGGGTASTSLGIANAAKYYPRSSCSVKKMIGVTLRFNYPADFFFRIDSGPVGVCKKITTTSITGVARGVVLGP